MTGLPKLVTGPTEEPITLAEAKAHLRQTEADEDSLIDDLILQAREWTESATERVWVTQTWDVFLDEFPDGDLGIPHPPLQSVTSVKYTDVDAVTATFDASNYYVDTVMEPGRIVLNSGASWPSVTLRPANGVEVRFVAGYGLAVAVPQRAKGLMHLLVEHWYVNRGSVTTGPITKKIELAVDSLKSQLRVFHGA